MIGNVKTAITKFNNIKGINSYYRGCSDCQKKVNIMDCIVMKRLQVHNPGEVDTSTTAAVDSGILWPHEFYGQKNTRDWNNTHFTCRCEECNNIFVYCYKSWMSIFYSNRKCNFCRWRQWGGIMLIIAVLALLVRILY